MNNYIVYIHKNKINQKRYIGITCQSPENRWGSNGSRYTKDKQEVFYNAIQKYGWENFEHIIVFENLSLEEASNKEQELIKYYHTFIRDPLCNGYNMTRGGEGNIKLDYDLIWKYWDEGKQISQIAKLIGASRSGIARALSTNPNYSPEESRSRMLKNYKSNRSLEIFQYDLNGNYIKSFPSFRDAARELNCEEGNISTVCDKPRRMCNGYMWSTIELPSLEPYRKNNGKGIKIEQYDLNNNFIGKYNSATEAEENTGFSRKSIAKAAKDNKIYKNFIWKITNKE